MNVLHSHYGVTAEILTWIETSTNQVFTQQAEGDVLQFVNLLGAE